MVLVPAANKKKILSYLFQEGVMCCAKDGLKPKHDDLDVPNLHVMMIMKSLTSMDYVTQVFNWQWFYYTLTDSGIEYLREQLYLPRNVEPATLTKAVKMSRPGVADPSERREKGEKGKGKKGKGKGKGFSSKGAYDDAEKPAAE